MLWIKNGMQDVHRISTDDHFSENVSYHATDTLNLV